MASDEDFADFSDELLGDDYDEDADGYDHHSSSLNDPVTLCLKSQWKRRRAITSASNLLTLLKNKTIPLLKWLSCSLYAHSLIPRALTGYTDTCPNCSTAITPPEVER